MFFPPPPSTKKKKKTKKQKRSIHIKFCFCECYWWGSKYRTLCNFGRVKVAWLGHLWIHLYLLLMMFLRNIVQTVLLLSLKSVLCSVEKFLWVWLCLWPELLSDRIMICSLLFNCTNDCLGSYFSSLLSESWLFAELETVVLFSLSLLRLWGRDPILIGEENEY